MSDTGPTIESRVLYSERALTSVQVTVARIDAKLESHEKIVADFRAENNRQFDELKAQMSGQLTNITKQLEPLKEAKWKASGVYTTMAAIVSAAVSLAVKFWK